LTKLAGKQFFRSPEKLKKHKSVPKFFRKKRFWNEICEKNDVIYDGFFTIFQEFGQNGRIPGKW